MKLPRPRRRTVEEPAEVVASDSATIRARLEDGPMAGRSVQADPVEGRPPKTIDVPGREGGCWRYCLVEWEQEGHTADYTFLYET